MVASFSVAFSIIPSARVKAVVSTPLAVLLLFSKVIYQRALEIEMANQFVVFKREFEMPIFYRQEQIGTRRVDFLVDEKISVELKAITKLEDVHFAQAINYLEAYNLEIGLLINFGTIKLEFHRLENKKFKPSHSSF